MVYITCSIGRSEDSQNVNPVNSLQKSPRPAPDLALRYLYLATDPACRIVKAGMSVRPATRLRGYVVGARMGRRSYSHAPFSVIWTHRMGVVTRREALVIERGLHMLLRPVADFHEGEWYRLRASEAKRIAIAYAAGDGRLGRLA